MGLITVEGIKVICLSWSFARRSYSWRAFYNQCLCGCRYFNGVEKTDDLEDTVDYVRIIEIVKEQMSIRSNMIEHPAKLELLDAYFDL